MRKMLLAAAALLAATAWAQTAREEINADLRLSASNYCAYPAPDASTRAAYKPAPQGYEPFYISAYARHGSRWLISENEYASPARKLHRADTMGVLTPLGREVMLAVDSISAMSRGRLGELTDVGAAQHRGIAERMAQNFPQVFKGEPFIEARSTPVVRCILSMMNELWVLKAHFPKAEMRTDASYHDLYYMNDEHNAVTENRKEEAARKSAGDYWQSMVSPDRLMVQLFTDTARARTVVNFGQLRDQLFDLASNMQSHSFDFNLYRLFTPEECYNLWLRDNYSWYVNYGPSPLTNGKLPLTQANLLRNFIETADTVIVSQKNAATLRFGHEVCVMPLACLLELDECGYQTDRPEGLDEHWRNYRIFPMASNVQMIFYRSPASRRILVKVMLNERECRLPVASPIAPYYDWQDVRQYYLKKLGN